MKLTSQALAAIAKYKAPEAGEKLYAVPEGMFRIPAVPRTPRGTKPRKKVKSCGRCGGPRPCHACETAYLEQMEADKHMAQLGRETQESRYLE